MVKNTTGGSRAKSQARKFTSEPTTNKIRMSNDPSEHYAIVTVNYGQGRFAARSADGKMLKCILRKKFSGRAKTTNYITVDGIVLVGARDWSSSDDICDLLEVYTPDEIMRLRAMPGGLIDSLVSTTKLCNTADDDYVVFSASAAAAPVDPGIDKVGASGASAASIPDTIDESWFDEI